jgi:hypothetical protein
VCWPQSGHHHHLIKFKLFSLWFSWPVAHLALSNNRSLTLGRLDCTNDSSRCSPPWMAPSSTYVDRIIYDRVWCQTGQYDCVWRTRIYAKGRKCVRFKYCLRRIPCKTLLSLLYMTGFLKRAGRHFRPLQNKVELINIERRIVLFRCKHFRDQMRLWCAWPFRVYTTHKIPIKHRLTNVSLV